MLLCLTVSTAAQRTVWTADFETLSSTGGLSPVVNKEAGARINFTSTVRYAGTQGLRVEVLKNSTFHWYIQLNTPLVSMQQGYSYVLTFWAKGDRDCPRCYWVFFSDAGFATKAQSMPSITQQWKSISIAFTPDKTANYMMQFNLGRVELGNYYLDDFYLTTNAPVSPVRPSSPPSVPTQGSKPPGNCPALASNVELFAGFEGCDTTTMTWGVYGGTATISTSSSTAKRTGGFGASARITSTLSKNWSIQLFSKWITLKPGKTYSLQTYVQGSRPSCSIQIALQGDARSKYEPYLLGFQSIATKTWQVVEVHGYKPTAARPAQVIIAVGKCGGVINIDDVRLTVK